MVSTVILSVTVEWINEMSKIDERKINNQRGLDDPRIGDYWNEMFCPYFLVVNVKDDKITVLSCLGGPNSFNRKDELNARIEVDNDSWTFDLSKSMIVNREWMSKAVKYESIDGFCADVTNNEKTVNIAMEWHSFKQKEMRKQIEQLESEWEEFTGWKSLKEGIPA